MNLEILSSSLLVKLLRFGVVGCTGVLIDFGITYIIKEKLNANKYLASSIGFCFAASSNYYLNRIWTFNSEDPHIFFQYTKFLAVATIGVVMSNGIVWLFHEKKKVNFYFAKATSIVIVMVWNFLVNMLVTFS